MTREQWAKSIGKDFVPSQLLLKENGGKTL